MKIEFINDWTSILSDRYYGWFFTPIMICVNKIDFKDEELNKTLGVFSLVVLGVGFKICRK